MHAVGFSRPDLNPVRVGRIGNALYCNTCASLQLCKDSSPGRKGATPRFEISIEQKRRPVLERILRERKYNVLGEKHCEAV